MALSVSSLAPYARRDFRGNGRFRARRPKKGNGYAYGICEVSKTSVRLEVIKGSLDLRYLSLDSRVKPVAKGVSIREGGTADFEI